MLEAKIDNVSIYTLFEFMKSKLSNKLRGFVEHSSQFTHCSRQNFGTIDELGRALLVMHCVPGWVVVCFMSNDFLSQVSKRWSETGVYRLFGSASLHLLKAGGN